MVMRSFQGDWREAYVISNSYEMGDPLASRFGEAGRTAEGGGVTSYHNVLIHRMTLKNVVFSYNEPTKNREI